MKKIALALIFAMCLFSPMAIAAEGEVSEAEAAKVMDALKAAGCSDGDIEKTEDGFDVIEADCGEDEYNIVLDKDYKITDKEKVEYEGDDASSDEDTAEADESDAEGEDENESDADVSVAPEVAAKVIEALKAAGCEGGDIEETEDGFEVEDAVCSEETFDLVLDKEFKIVEKEKVEDTDGSSVDDNDMTDEEAAKVIAALEAAGCTEGDIEKTDAGYKVEEAVCGDNEYTVTLDLEFKILSKDKD